MISEKITYESLGFIPVRTCAGSESDIGDRGVFACMNAVYVDFASEGLCRLQDCLSRAVEDVGSWHLARKELVDER